MSDGLNAESIRTILNNLVTQTCGFEVFAVTKDSPRLKKLSLTEAGDDGGLKSILKNMMLDIIRERYLAEDATYTPAENVADNQYKFYIVKQTEQYKPFEFLTADQEDFKEDHLKDITDFVFVFRYGTQTVSCFQKGRSITVPNRKGAAIMTKVFCHDNSVILDQQKEPLITITKAIDALIIDGFIITDNIKMMERNFDFQIFISQKAREAAASVARSGFYSNTSKLDEYLSRGGGRQKTYYKKMMRALDSPVLLMTAEALFLKVSTVERWKGKFKEPVDGKIPIDTFKEVESLIDLLDERYTVSEVTGQEYDTDVKKKAEETNSEGETPQ